MFGRKRELIALRAALSWYADESNYRRTATHAKGEAVQWVKSDIARDRGAIARFALANAHVDKQAMPALMGALPRRASTRPRPTVPAQKPVEAD